MSEKKTLDLVMITDDKYCIFTAIALTSLVDVMSPEVRYVAHICVNQVSEENVAKISSLERKGAFEVKIHRVGGLEKYEEKFRNNLISATPTSLYKFLLPEILKDLDKVLYIDGDVLFQKDISWIFDTDLDRDGLYAAVTPETVGSHDDPPFMCRRLKCNHASYFNSGLMLLNLKKLREDGVPQKLMDYKLNGINFLMDQDAFNVVFAEKVYCLHPITFPSYYVLESKEINPLYEVRSKREALKKASILHLCTKRKPWVVKIPGITRRYFAVKKRSPYADIEMRPIGYMEQYYNRIYDALEGSILHKAIHSVTSLFRR